MPAFEEGIAQAAEEGVSIIDGWGPKRIRFDGEILKGIEVVRCESVFDASGTFCPVFDESTMKVLDADMIVLAVGQAADLSLLPKEIVCSDDKIRVDALTLETSVPGVFAGGEIVTGPSTVVDAVAAGKRAAISIDRYLRGEDLAKGRDTKPGRIKNPPKEGIMVLARQQTMRLRPGAGGEGFAEVRMGFDEDTAYLESRRCMTCGSRAVINTIEECRLCQACERVCPQKALAILPAKKVEPLVKIAGSWGEIAEWIGVDPGLIEKTVEDYNAACDRGYDPVFGKERRHLIPLLRPPYYAIRCGVDYLDAIGGIKIDEQMKVVDDQGNPIPGLYAAGIDTGGWEGDSYCIKLAGTTFAFAINSGRIAGENAAEFVSGEKKR